MKKQFIVPQTLVHNLHRKDVLTGSGDQPEPTVDPNKEVTEGNMEVGTRMSGIWGDPSFEGEEEQNY